MKIRGIILILFEVALTLAPQFVSPPGLQAVNPGPDGGYPGANTADDQ